jgi:two-component system, NarL family, response regulator LiaR
MTLEIEPITIVLADDHAITRHGLRALLETASDVSIVGEAANGQEAVKLCADHAPDVALVDMIMPDVNGLEVTRRVKTVSPRTQVVILTSYHEDEYLLPAVKAGALSYLLKDISPDELLRAVRKAAQGEAMLQPKIASQLMRSLHADAEKNNRFGGLSDRELDVLRLIAEGLSNADIGSRLFISEKTVKSHVGNILSKLHLTDRTQAAVLAWKEGLMKSDR